MYDVIISGYYGFMNNGDDAILMAIIDNLRMLKEDIKIMVLSANPSETRKIYNVDSINRLNMPKIWQVMKNSKLFINGGGNLIQDETSTRSLMYYLGTIWLAKKAGLKVMIYANGIGPINREFNRKLTQMIVNQVDVITLREEISKGELDSLCINKPRIIVTADPALNIEPEDEEEIDRVFREEGIDLPGPYIGFSVREWESHEKYEGIIAQIADYVIDKYSAKPVFIPMHYPKDLIIIDSIVSKMKGKGYIIRNKYSATYVLGMVKKMEMLIGMRLHALIYAASLGVPLIGLVYESKVEGFLQYINQASAGHVKQLEFNSLKNMVDDVWSKRTGLDTKFRESTMQLKEKALENAKIAIELIEGKY